MSLVVSTEKMEGYRAGGQQRRRQRAERLARRHERALQVAAQAAQILLQQFHSERVVLFGSVLLPDSFHLRSDIDLAVWGLAEQDHYRAVGQLLSLDQEFSVGVIRAESAPLRLLAIIEREGKLL
jgi:predicted nucleotidyltransferase